MIAEVFIGEKSVRVPEAKKLNLSANYRLSDIRNIKTRGASSTKTLSLPASKQMRKIFGFPEDPNSVDAFNNDRKLKGRIEVGGTVIIRGFVRLKNTRMTGSGKTLFYEINIISDNSDWKTDIKDRSLQDQDWSEYDHAFNLENQIISELTDDSAVASTLYNRKLSDEFIVYPLINYGKFNGLADRREITTRDQRPAFNVRFMLLKIFNDLGYKVISEHIDSPLFRSLYLPFTRKEIGAADGFDTANSFNVGMSADAVYNTNYVDSIFFFVVKDLTATDPVDEFFVFRDTVAFDVETGGDFFDNPGAFTPASNIPNTMQDMTTYTPITGADYTVPINSKQKFTANIQGRIDLEYGALQPILQNSEILRPVQQIRVNISVKVNGNKVAAINNTLLMDPVPVPLFTTQSRNFNTTIETEEIDLLAGDKVRVDVEYFFANGQVVQSTTGAVPIIVSQVNSTLTLFKESTLRNEVLFDVLEGSPIGINKNLPAIEQLHLVQGLKHLFEWYFDTDSDERTVVIEPRTEFYTGQSIDWRKKLDRRSNVRVVGLGDGEHKQIRHRYKEDDTDIAIAQRELEIDDILGASLSQVTNRFAKDGIDENTNPVWAPTAMDIEPEQLGFTRSKIPKMWKDFSDDDAIAPDFDTDFVNRILVYNGITDLADGEEGYRHVRKKGDSNQFTISQLPPRTNYPFMYSINEAVVNDNSLYFDTRDKSHGLFEKHHQSTLKTINEGKLIRCKLNLTPKDIETLNFRTPILMDFFGEPVVCVLNAVLNYNPLSTSPTDVEFITSEAEVQLSTLVNKADPTIIKTVKKGRRRSKQTQLQTNDDGTIKDVWVTDEVGDVVPVFSSE